MDISALSTASTTSNALSNSKLVTIPVEGNLQESLLLMTEEQINYNIVELKYNSYKVVSLPCIIKIFCKNSTNGQGIPNSTSKIGISLKNYWIVSKRKWMLSKKLSLKLFKSMILSTWMELAHLSAIRISKLLRMAFANK